MRILNKAKNENFTEITTVQVRNKKECMIAGAVFATVRAFSTGNLNEGSTRRASVTKIFRTEARRIPVAAQRHTRPKSKK